MGLTRVAHDPWTESVSVPTFEPPPVEIKSCHVPLTAERAEELVRTHLERTGLSIQKSRDKPLDPADAGASGAAAAALAASSLAPSDSLSRHAAVTLETHLDYSASQAPPPAISPAEPRVPHLAAGLGNGYCGAEDGADGDGEANGGGEVQCQVLDAALVDAWMRGVEGVAEGVEEEQALTFGRGAQGSSGAAPSSRRPVPLRPASSQGPLSRRLSCPESLLSITEGSAGGAGSSGGGGGADSRSGGGGEPGAAPEQEDALEPLANHHTWMYGRGRLDRGGQGLLYSPSGVLEAHHLYGDGVAGSWQPRDAASIFGGGAWDLPSSGGGSAAGRAARTRIGKLLQEGAGAETIRTLAAVIIQSYCRGWQARRRVARMKSLLRSEESRKMKERAAAEALARERETVRRRLRAAAKDCLLAVQAQQDYERTRARMAAARGLSGGAAAAPPPPPPTIPQALWERCKALGQDPIEVLLESGLQSHQIEEIISTSQLASQLPRRAAAAAARMGVPLAPVPEGPSRPASRSSYGGAPRVGTKGGSTSDDGAAATAAAAAAAASAGVVVGGLAAAAVARGGPPLTRRLSLPGRPLLPSQRSVAGPVSVPGVPRQAMNTSQLVEQMLAQQQQQTQQLVKQQQQHTSYSVNAGTASGLGPAVRRASGPGALTSAGTPPPAPLRRQPSPSPAAMALSVENSLNGAGMRQVSGVAPGAHLGGGFAAGPMPMRGAPPPQLYPTHSHSHQQQWGAPGGLGGPRVSAPVPLVRGTSRRMSDFVGGAGQSLATATAGGGAAASLAAVGNAAMVGLGAAAPPPGPVRARSLGLSDSGAEMASLSSGQPSLPPQPQPYGKVMLPAVPQTPPASTGGSLASKSSGEMKAGGSGAVAAAAAASGGAGAGAAGTPAGAALAASASVPAAGTLPPPPPSAQQPLQAAQQQQPLQYVPHHMSQPMQGLVESAISSPVTRPGPQSSPGCSTDGSPALLRRHSFVEQQYGGVVGAKSSPNSFTSAGGAAAGVSGAAADNTPSAALMRSANAAAAASAAGRTSTAGGGGGGGFPGHLPPLLPSQGSSGFLGISSGGGSSGAASPSAASAAAAAGLMSGSPNGSSAALAAGAVGEVSFGRASRRVSNLAPQGAPFATALAAAAVAAASPPPGPPPTMASPFKSFRRLTSLTHAGSSTAAALAGAASGLSGGAPAPALSRVMSAGGSSVAAAATAAAAAAVAAIDAAEPLATRASLPPSGARPPVAMSSSSPGGVASRAS